jgi:hypothetical protein
VVDDEARSGPLLICQVEGGAKAGPDLIAADAAGADQPPGQRRVGDAGEVEVGAGPGGPGRVGIAAAGGDRVVAADVEQQSVRFTVVACTLTSNSLPPAVAVPPLRSGPHFR